MAPPCWQTQRRAHDCSAHCVLLKPPRPRTLDLCRRGLPRQCGCHLVQPQVRWAFAKHRSVLRPPPLCTPPLSRQRPSKHSFTPLHPPAHRSSATWTLPSRRAIALRSSSSRSLPRRLWRSCRSSQTRCAARGALAAPASPLQLPQLQWQQGRRPVKRSRASSSARGLTCGARGSCRSKRHWRRSLVIRALMRGDLQQRTPCHQVGE